MIMRLEMVEKGLVEKLKLVSEERRKIAVKMACGIEGQTTFLRDGKNNSSGGAVGISLGVGSEGGGLSIFANANKGTGNEKGTGTTWTETTLDAGKQVSLISGRDTALKGAQVSADKITATVGVTSRCKACKTSITTSPNRWQRARRLRRSHSNQPLT